MLSVDEIANFEGLLKMAHSSVKQSTVAELSGLIIQINEQADSIIRRYTVDDSEVIIDLIIGVNLLGARLKTIGYETNAIVLEFIANKLEKLTKE